MPEIGPDPPTTITTPVLTAVQLRYIVTTSRTVAIGTRNNMSYAESAENFGPVGMPPWAKRSRGHGRRERL